MQVFVTGPEGKKYTVDIEGEHSIADLKAKVAKQARVPAEHLRLFWEHAKIVVDELRDETTCRDVGIKMETELRMAVSTGGQDSDDPVEEAWVAMNEALAEMTRLRDSFGKAREELRRSQAKLASRTEALQQRSEVKIKDRIKVQTSTLLISTRRSVLGYFPSTRLAALVSGCYDSEFLKADDHPFFDENSECFRELARFLSQCKDTPAGQALPPLPTGPVGLETEMTAMLSNFGITEAHEQSTSDEVAVPEGHPPHDAGRVQATAASEAAQHQVTGRNALLDVPTSTHQLESAMELQKGALAAAFEQHAELVAKFEADQEWAKRYIKSPSCRAASEVVQLDVSGVLVRTIRRTLTLCSGSALAQRFEKNLATGAEQSQATQAGEGESSHEDSEEEDDEDEATVIAEDPYCFLKILDHLRARAAATLDVEVPPPTIPAEKKGEFAKVVAKYFPGKETFILGSPEKLPDGRGFSGEPGTEPQPHVALATEYPTVFHNKIDRNCQLSAGNTTLTRTEGFMDACGATAKPVPFVDGAWRFNLKLEKPLIATWSGSLEVGFTSLSPDSQHFEWKGHLGASYTEGSMWSRDTSFLENVGFDSVGDVVNVALLPTGAFDICINGQTSDILQRKEKEVQKRKRKVIRLPPAGATLFGVVGVFGKTAAVSLTSSTR